MHVKDTQYKCMWVCVCQFVCIRVCLCVCVKDTQWMSVWVCLSVRVNAHVRVCVFDAERGGEILYLHLREYVYLTLHTQKPRSSAPLSISRQSDCPSHCLSVSASTAPVLASATTRSMFVFKCQFGWCVCVCMCMGMCVWVGGCV